MALIRPARATEARAISDLAFRSKSHWPYTAAQLEVFRGELTLSPEEVAAKRSHVAEEEGTILGFYTLVSVGRAEMELEHIFVDPRQLKRGIGSQLFRHACETARAGAAARLVIQSDPNAAGFYHSVGAVLEKEIPSSIPGRSIPYFTYSLTRGDGS